MRYLLETNNNYIINNLNTHRDVIVLTRLDDDFFKPSLGKPLKVVQIVCNTFCVVTGNDKDHMSRAEFSMRVRIYMESLGPQFGTKTDAQIIREARKHCGFKTKVVRHGGKCRRMFTGVRFRDSESGGGP